MEEYRLKHCRFTIDDEARRVETIFDDGEVVAGTPYHDEESIARARALGYAGTDEEVVWQMTRHHDLLHHLVAEAEGQPWSAVMHAVAHDYDVPPGVGEREERIVFLLQRLLNVGLDGVLAEARSIAS
jgi:hypothetical protein